MIVLLVILNIILKMIISNEIINIWMWRNNINE